MSAGKSFILKITYALFACIALTGCAGCGGRPALTPLRPTYPAVNQPSTPSHAPISQVFSPPAAGQSAIWSFQDGYQHRMWITVTAVPCAFGICDSNIAVWHFQKDSCAGYWNPRTPAQCAASVTLDELWFVLHRDPDGAWRCIGFTYIDYLGTKRKAQILTPFGAAPPYTIIPANSATSDPPTSYSAVIQILPAGANMEDFTVPSPTSTFSTSWQTIAGVEQIKLGSSLISALFSRQHEGCVEENWDFTDSGVQPLVSIDPIVGLGDNGACVNMDPLLTMRIVDPLRPALIGPFEKP